MRPLLSVIMPTYNGERFVKAALESVRGEHLEAIELVVVDDGSTDRTLEIVRGFESVLPIRLMTPARMGNWVAATNLGLREASGEWACFLHQDDLWLAGRVARLLPEMHSAPGALILHDAKYVGPHEEDLGPWTCPLLEGLVPSSQFVEHLLVQNFIAIPSPIFRRKPAVDSGGLNEALWFSADWDLWLRLGSLGPVRFLPETLAAFRIHPESQTAARKLLPGEWEQQLSTVLAAHLRIWPGEGRLRQRVARVAKASIAVNSALSATSRGERARYATLLFRLLRLGPAGWHVYLRDSRIVQRVSSRLKLKREPDGPSVIRHEHH